MWQDWALSLLCRCALQPAGTARPVYPVHTALEGAVLSAFSPVDALRHVNSELEVLGVAFAHPNVSMVTVLDIEPELRTDPEKVLGCMPRAAQLQCMLAKVTRLDATAVGRLARRSELAADALAPSAGRLRRLPELSRVSCRHAVRSTAVEVTAAPLVEAVVPWKLWQVQSCD